MKIAVTGATGFLGRYIAQRLLDAGHDLRCWHRPTSDLSGIKKSSGRLVWLEGELGESAAGSALVEDCDAVIHAALYHPGGGFRGGEGDLLSFAHKNVLGTLALIEAARAAAVKRFIFISTCAVHEKILEDRPLDETHPLWPKSHYGAHKAAIEKFIHSYGFGQGYKICSLRPTGIYGLAHPPQHSKWFSLVQKIVRGETVHCRGGGKEVHAADVAAAVELLLTAEGIAGQAYSCYDRYVSEHEVAMLAKQFARSRSDVLGEPGQPRNQIVTSKLESLGMKFGGQPLLDRTVEQLVAAAS